MSAFVVSRDHVSAIVRAGLAPHPRIQGSPLRWNSSDDPNVWESSELRLETADQVGQMLTDECVRSVSYRYQGNEELPGSYPDGDFGDWFEPFHFSPMQPGRCPTPVETLKLIDCLEYQSCEHPGWADSEARRFCEALRRRMIGCLSGYHEADWEYRPQRIGATA